MSADWEAVRDQFTAALHRSVCDEIPDGGATCDELADALLPVVDRLADQRAAAELLAAAQEQRNEAKNVPDTDEGTHADGHRCAADFLDRRAAHLDPS